MKVTADIIRAALMLAGLSLNKVDNRPFNSGISPALALEVALRTIMKDPNDEPKPNSK